MAGPQELETLKCDTMTHAKLPPHYGQTDAKVNIVLILGIEEHSLIIRITVP